MQYIFSGPTVPSPNQPMLKVCRVDIRGRKKEKTGMASRVPILAVVTDTFLKNTGGLYGSIVQGASPAGAFSIPVCARWKLKRLTLSPSLLFD